MSPVAKGFLIGCSILLVLGVVAVVAVVWFAKTKGTELMTRAEQARDQGLAFGKYTTESECQAEALKRYSGDRGIMSGVKHGVWLTGCLEASTLEPDFCKDVPAQTDIQAAAIWRTERCKAAGITGDASCPNVLAPVQEYCESSVRRQKMSR